MKGLTKPKLVLILAVILLAGALALCAWLFGWGRGSIQVIDFSADQVDHVRLSCAQLYNQDAAVIQDPEEIQQLIDEANSLRHTGSDVKWIFQYGLFSGGSMLHEYNFQLKNGETFIVTFASNRGGQPVTDMELSYWATTTEGEKISGSTCRGSLEAFYRLHREYLSY